MISGEHTLTASGRMRKAELNIICNWIKQTWDDIPTEMIQKSFLKCCITNALDGTEDDDVWEVLYQKRVQVFHQGFQTPRNR